MYVAVLEGIQQSVLMSNREESRMTFQMLPDDLVLNCLARVPIMYYPSLSLVSKRFRSILASTEFPMLRSFLGCTGTSLYVCLRIYTSYNTNTRIWFTLRQSPISHSKVLVPVSSPNSPFDYKSGVAAVDSNIYAIGGFINNNASSNVMVMDCRSHTWREAPCMRVAREYPSTCVLNGKIYVIGGCNNLDSTNWIEVFDKKTETWEFLQIPSEEICRGSKYKSVGGYGGTIHVTSEETHATYKLHKGRWREGEIGINRYYNSSICVINNVLYRYGGWTTIFWYDSNARFWKALKGLPKSFKIVESFRDTKAVKLVDFGGNMALFWEEDMTLFWEEDMALFWDEDMTLKQYKKKKQIWCAEIALEKKQQGEIWGTLKWSNVVFITDQFNVLVHALATTV